MSDLTETEKWLSKLGTEFVTIWLLVRGEWIDERHVADPETLATTVDMSASRLGAKAAVWPEFDNREPAGWWAWTFRGDRKARLMPSREAAEMYSIHTHG